ncbi:hypothetical protein K6U62_21135 [Vibrio vulnificus]|nr:hypothetical protein [Vibrio vulnificus]
MSIDGGSDDVARHSKLMSRRFNAHGFTQRWLSHHTARAKRQRLVYLLKTVLGEVVFKIRPNNNGKVDFSLQGALDHPDGNGTQLTRFAF